MHGVALKEALALLPNGSVELIVAKHGTGVSTGIRGRFSQQNDGNSAYKAGCIDKVCSTPAQLPVWLISSSSKLKANAVLR